MRKPSKIHRKKAATTSAAPAKPYMPTIAEHNVLSQLLERLNQAAPQAGAKVEMQEGCARLSWDHPSQTIAAILWANSLATTDFIFAGTLFEQLAQVSRTGTDLTEKEFNGMLSLVRGVAPADPTEALLAVQMAAVHNAMMVAARRLAHVESIAQQDSASTMFNKLARTFAAQVEALKRYRHHGEQTIKVQHVTVNEGGRAIVGDVQHAPGGSLKSERQSHELTPPNALGPALLGNVQTNGQSMPPPAVKGRPVCRFHGAHAGAPNGPANGAYRHGNHTNEARDVRRTVARLRREAHALIARL